MNNFKKLQIEDVCKFVGGAQRLSQNRGSLLYFLQVQ